MKKLFYITSILMVLFLFYLLFILDKYMPVPDEPPVPEWHKELPINNYEGKG